MVVSELSKGDSTASRSGYKATTSAIAEGDLSPNLDLLRTIAVSLVLIQHVLLTLHIRKVGIWEVQYLGVIGVYMFFVHTSLVLMWSLRRRPDPVDFYIRRFFRIYPIAIVCILLTVVFRLPTKHDAAGDIFYYAPSVSNLVSNLLLIQNFVWRGSILGVTWTLPLEIDMYLLLPFLYTMSLGKGAFSRIISLWAGFVLFCSVFPGDVNIISCAPVFLAGILASILFRTVRPRVSGYLLPLLLVGIVCVVLSRPAWPVVWCSFLILGLTLPLFRPIRVKWLVSASHQIAKYSYGIYLIHPFCIVIGFSLLGGYSLPIRVLGTLIPLVAIVVPTYHFLEKPMIDLGAEIAGKLRRLPVPLAEEA